MCTYCFYLINNSSNQKQNLILRSTWKLIEMKINGVAVKFKLPSIINNLMLSLNG